MCPQMDCDLLQVAGSAAASFPKEEGPKPKPAERYGATQHIPSVRNLPEREGVESRCGFFLMCLCGVCACVHEEDDFTPLMIEYLHNHKLHS